MTRQTALTSLKLPHPSGDMKLNEYYTIIRDEIAREIFIENAMVSGAAIGVSTRARAAFDAADAFVKELKARNESGL